MASRDDIRATVSMEDIRAAASTLGIDISNIDLDSIRLPPGEDFGILR